MYNSLKGMLREVENFNGDLAELIIANEISKTEKTREDVIAEMTKRRGIMKDSSEAATGRDMIFRSLSFPECRQTSRNIQIKTILFAEVL